MDFLKIAIAAFSATNIMTTFSYIISDRYGKLFKEPVMLNYILQAGGICLSGKKAKFEGWLAHYVIGFLYVLAYEAVCLYTAVEFGWYSAILFGIISGFIGICSWQMIYRLPDKKPKVPLHEYYLQLFFAHIIFAGAVSVAFLLYEYDAVGKVYDAI